MPVQTSLHSLNILNQHKNGVDFTLNTSDTTTDFTALVGEKVRAISQVNLTWYAEGTPSDPWEITAGAIYRPGGSFSADGFLVGQRFEFYNDWAARITGTAEFIGTITAIQQGGKYMTFTVTGTQTTTGSAQTNVGCWADLTTTPGDAPDALFFRWNLLPNGDTFSPTSLTTDETQGYYASGLTASPTTMTVEGTFQGWVNGSATAEKESTSYEKNTTTYKITHDFLVTPYFLASWLTNITTGSKPPLYQQNTSLAYMFQCEFRHGLTQTTGAKFADITDLQGLTGYFNESFGGIAAAYSVGSATYQDTATTDSKTGLQKYAKTTVSFTLSKSSGAFSAGQKIGVYVSYLPATETEYQQTTTNFASNFMFDSAFHTEGTGATVGSGIIKSLQGTLNTGDIDVTMECEYTSGEQLRINDGDYFAIWVICEDSALTAPNSDRTVLLLSADQYDVASEIDGLASWTKFDLFPHQLEYGTDPGISTAINAWDEDGLLIDWAFNIDTSKNAVVTGLTFKLVAYNSSTEDEFELDSYSYDLSGVITSSGIQQIDIDTTRGYKLKSGDQFNFVKSETGSFSSPNQAYSGAVGQKIKWQEWVQNLDVDTVFYDNSEPQNNLNYKTDNYSGLNGYVIHLKGVLTLTGTDTNGQAGGSTVVRRSSAITVLDYGQSDSTWTGVLYTLDPDTLSDLNGTILGNKNTLFRIVWTETADINNVYAIHRIEQASNPSDDISELSSLNLPPTSNNILIPKTGQTLTTLAVVGSDIHSECLIDYTQIDPNKQYNLSGRVERFTAAANFLTSFPGCDVRLTNIYSGGGTITDIQYDFYLGLTLVKTENTLLTAYDWEPGSLFPNESIRIVQTISLDVGGPVVTEATVLFPAFSGCYIQYTSDAAGSDTVDPSVVDGAAESYWRFPNDVVQTGNVQSHLGSSVGFDGTTQNVFYRCTDYTTLQEFDSNSDKVTGAIDFTLGTALTEIYMNANPGLTGVTFGAATANTSRIDFDDCNITGNVNLTPIGAFLAGRVEFDDNPLLTGITNPVSSQTITRYRFRNCNLTGNLSIANLTGLQELAVNDNPLLTSITNPSSSAVFTSYHAYNCNLTGALNVSALLGLAGSFQVDNNPLLTSITNPSNSQVFTFYKANDCNLTGTHDFSGLTGLGGEIWLSDNPLLTAITNPTSSQSITRYRVQDCNLTGTLDISGLTGQVDLNADNNSLLTAITNATSSANWVGYQVTNTGLTGTLDVSGLSGLGGTFNVYDNSSLTGITNPTSSQVFLFYQAYDCNLTGTLSLANLTGLGGRFDVSRNSNLTAITNPTSSQAFTHYLADDCDLTGTLNVSGLTGLAGSFRTANNGSLTSITFPASSGTIDALAVQNCDLGYVDITGMTFDAAIEANFDDNNMTAAEVNQILVDLDATLPGTGTGTIDINGTNAAPDGTSGGYDGLTAKSNLISSGYTVNTN